MLIALSGGADSVALLLLMLEKGRVEAAAHCNFRLRGDESDRDEAFVRRLCRERGVPLHVKHFDTRTEAARTGESIEMAARRLRYAWFAELCRTHHYDGIAVAHHRDDQAETLLLNLVRGSGLHGLTGMQRQTVAGVVRPLLQWSKTEILQYLREKNQTYVTDSTNADTRYKRNLVRHEVIPLLRQLNPRVVETLCETAVRLAEAETIYRLGLETLRNRLVIPRSEGKGFNIPLDGLLQAPAPRTLLHEWLSPYGFTAAQLDEALQMRTGALLQTEGWLLTRTADALQLTPTPPATTAPLRLPENGGTVLLNGGHRLHLQRLPRHALDAIPRDSHIACLDADSLSLPLEWRAPLPGERFRPLGMQGSQTVNQYLTNRHRSRTEKMEARVVADSQGILWLAGERIAHRAAVTPTTQHILLITLESQ